MWLRRSSAEALVERHRSLRERPIRPGRNSAMEILGQAGIPADHGLGRRLLKACQGPAGTIHESAVSALRGSGG